MSTRLRVLMVASVLVAGHPAVGAGKAEDLSRILLEDSSYKVRLQAALLLGRLGDRTAGNALIRALGDENKTVRAMAAQSLAKLRVTEAVGPLKMLLGREKDKFVRAQAEKALATLGPEASPGGEARPGLRSKIYLTFGSFSGGAKAADATMLELLRASIRGALGKLSTVTFSLEAGEEKSFGKSGRLGFLIDGNVTRLDDGLVGGAMETNCDLKVMVARWPAKSIILWTNAGAAVQGGSRERDKEISRRECLEASASQVGEDLAKFFQSQGG